MSSRRRMKVNETASGKNEDCINDATPDKSEVDDFGNGDDAYDSRETKAKSQIAASNFKANIERFRHGADESDGNEPAYKISRKRPVDDSATNSTPPNSSLTKRKKPSSKYAPPSKYAHLPKLLDILEPDLICIFVGTNPGIRTATAGHAYAHPSNLFWKLLHSSGCTDVRLPPENDVNLPEWYAMGNTNIVERPSKDAAELSKEEMAAGTPVLEEKIRRFRPEAVCIVGKGIWEAVWRYRYGRPLRKHEFRWGWQDEKERMGRVEAGEEDEGETAWDGAPVFVTSSTSGSAASLKPAEKELIWAPFGEWVRMRRHERYGTEGRIDRPVHTKPGDESKVKRGL
ncbi:DNA glycosylase [Hortaea werneckii]|nr:DNA glycosylase [Hortaea werneckii]KAI6897059.1 DNA glycosylase [Hortaea werneckii]KAI6919033.1 DNA glycosylase [Hortaea werneckii]KAI6952454.1 DNA glycosylase [Hortaea werneckii]KAI6958843.1 DNA glycosylase [Hortaea werneckii]